ncbi:uncharacterized protein LOC100378707 [Saccoglossus kowalevskii]|uniref:Proline-rich protein 2-like n=1 Tax=Saccoglossus kowalevskii TaxID=10224 RepID=A0ABM0GL97_SACKO|nr:PREDICTED: proline-rich protein 2-like [Saccoglossus kowalevskii]
MKIYVTLLVCLAVTVTLVTSLPVRGHSNGRIDPPPRDVDDEIKSDHPRDGPTHNPGVGNGAPHHPKQEDRPERPDVDADGDTDGIIRREKRRVGSFRLRPQQSQQPERPIGDGSLGSVRPEKPDGADRPGQPERPDKPVGEDRPGRPDDSDIPEGAVKPKPPLRPEEEDCDDVDDDEIPEEPFVGDAVNNNDDTQRRGQGRRPHGSRPCKPRPSGMPPRPSGHPPRPSGHPPRPSGHPPRPSGHPPRPSGHPPRPSGHPPRPSGYPPRPSDLPPQFTDEPIIPTQEDEAGIGGFQ